MDGTIDLLAKAGSATDRAENEYRVQGTKENFDKFISCAAREEELIRAAFASEEELAEIMRKYNAPGVFPEENAMTKGEKE